MPKISCYTVCRINSDFIPVWQLHNNKKYILKNKQTKNGGKKRHQLTHISGQKRPGSSSAASCHWGRIPPGGQPWLGVSLGLRQQVVHPPVPPFYIQLTFAHTSSQVTRFWRVTRPSQWTQQWRPKTERESKPPWRKSLHFPAPRRVYGVILCSALA